MKYLITTVFFLLTAVYPFAQSLTDTIELADPTIFFHNGVYYLYGTGGKDGFLVYKSSDLKNWSGPAGVDKGYALMKGNAYGTKGFWAPQVIYYSNKFYMAYTADEHIAIAEADNPLGPFKQKNPGALPGDGKQIDPFIFIDEDGKKYLYHVRLTNGNRIFSAELKDDFSGIKEGTLKECVTATENWENTDLSKWPVSEGPTVVKHKSLYYLIYSANDFRNINYAVGYATAQTPYGPWQKHTGNPFISRHVVSYNGTGHGDLVKDKKGDLYYVLHVHASANTVSPRKTAIIKVSFLKDGQNNVDKIVAHKKSFHFLLQRKK